MKGIAKIVYLSILMIVMLAMVKIEANAYSDSDIPQIKSISMTPEDMVLGYGDKITISGKLIKNGCNIKSVDVWIHAYDKNQILETTYNKSTSKYIAEYKLTPEEYESKSSYKLFMITVYYTRRGSKTLESKSLYHLYNDDDKFLSEKAGAFFFNNSLKNKLKLRNISAKSTKKKQVTFKWAKNSKAHGYTMQYSTNKQFKNCKTITITGKKNCSKVVTNLKSGKKYYYRICSNYNVTYGYYAEVRGPWSNTKTIKVK